MKSFKQKQLFFSKAFFGSMIRNWNPQNQPFISGVRFRIHVVDLVYSNFHLRKFSRMLYCASLKRCKTLFVFRPHYSPLYPLTVPFACYAPYYIGGLISNFKSVRRYYALNNVTSYLPRFPDIAVFLNDLTRMDYLVNEGFVTRTPFVFFGDSSTNLQRSVYGVGGKIFDYGTASFITKFLLTIIKRARAKSKLSFKRLLACTIKMELRSRIAPSNYYLMYSHLRHQQLSSLSTKYVSSFSIKSKHPLSKLHYVLKATMNRFKLKRIFRLFLFPTLKCYYLHMTKKRSGLVDTLKKERLFFNWIAFFSQQRRLLSRKKHRFSYGKKHRPRVSKKKPFKKIIPF